MKRTNLNASVLWLASIFAASFTCAQNLPVDLAGNVAGVNPSIRLTKLINTSLKSRSGESLGVVQDLIVDPVTGQIQFAILNASAGETSGVSTTSGVGTTPGATGTTVGGQFVAIPWRLVSSSSPGQYTANIDRTKLQSAPTFSGSAWPTLDAAWMRSVDSHYGLSGTSTGRPGSNTGTGTGTGTGIESPSTPSSRGTPGLSSPSGLRPAPGTAPSGGTGTGTGSGASGSGGAGSGSGGGK